MSQADSEYRLASHQAANVIDRIGAGLGIARSIRQENSIRLQRQHIFRRSLRWNDGHLAAFSAQLAQDVLLDAEVVGDHVEARWLVFYADYFVGQVRALAGLPYVGVVGGDDLREILTVHFRDRARLGDEFIGVFFERRNNAPHHSVGPQVADQRARVNLG